MAEDPDNHLTLLSSKRRTPETGRESNIDAWGEPDRKLPSEAKHIVW